MAEITKYLGLAISDADAGRITKGQLLDIFQEAIDNGDILLEDNEFYVVCAVIPLLDQGLLRRSEHVDVFERQMNQKLVDHLAEIPAQERKPDRVAIRFHVGLFDWLFGERVELEVPQDDGSMRTVRVTKRWLEKLEREGKMVRTDGKYVTMHSIGPEGYQKSKLKIGDDITREQYEKLVDKGTKALYAITVYENGQPTTSVIPKYLWDQAKAQMDAIDKEVKSLGSENRDSRSNYQNPTQ